MAPRGLVVERSGIQFDGVVFHEFTVDHGSLNAVFDPRSGLFGISNVDVDGNFRRRGLGKAMIQEAYDFAQSIGAGCIYSAITSRECLDAMRSVFGDDVISVSREGTYGVEGEKDHRDAGAFLWVAM